MNTVGLWIFLAKQKGALLWFRLKPDRVTGYAWLCRMKPHDRLRIVFAEARQYWRALAYVLQVHENHFTKRAGVAGIRARAGGN